MEALRPKAGETLEKWPGVQLGGCRDSEDGQVVGSGCAGASGILLPSGVSPLPPSRNPGLKAGEAVRFCHR